jgi:hypothetical protein
MTAYIELPAFFRELKYTFAAMGIPGRHINMMLTTERNDAKIVLGGKLAPISSKPQKRDPAM